jgi:hypothetical protein
MMAIFFHVFGVFRGYPRPGLSVLPRFARFSKLS